ncbi:NLP/P60 [Mycolicibacterium thermoresistibile]|jgi:hypothetical protein|uniref:NLP/P60 n=2 Tax=Mycolicibacterium thermoresistibile TaxID=1797 RepID=A0A124E805_MYCTH|nr:NLP/P60 [Mycolicibacterium thermoresistibile]
MGQVQADPAADAMARLDELSRQALQSREEVTAAQREVDAKLAEQSAAEERHRADQEALAAANIRLQPHQEAVNKVAAMTYMGGSTDPISATLTATAPQQLIDRLAIQRMVTVQITERLASFRAERERAAGAARASERSAAEARAAAERAAAEKEQLQAKWKDLLRQIAAAEAQYAALTPEQQQMVVNAAAPVPGAGSPLELAAARADLNLESLPVGVAPEAGLQPNTVLVARAISARFPQIAEIGGVRPDSLPWHPSGLAIDVMIPNHHSPEGIALGDEIMAFVLSNAARFGVQDVIWRGTYYTPSGPQGSGYGHFDHVHVTTLPGR